MQSEEQIKEMVKQKYSEIALQDKGTNASSCCGAGGCSNEVYNIMSEDYVDLAGYTQSADLGLGCGLPTQFAKIKKGDTVIDLGSGAGNDCFVARAETGETGKVIGIDFTPAMIEKARSNAENLSYNNVEFRLGDIEKMPVGANVADVIVSNCVLNLVPNKAAVFQEMYRVLKPAAHFSISDIVLTGSLPEKILSAAEMYAGCVASAIDKELYLSYIRSAGFTNIVIQKDKPIVVPDDILTNYLNENEIAIYKANDTVIRSITVYAEKPASACVPGSGWCYAHAEGLSFYHFDQALNIVPNVGSVTNTVLKFICHGHFQGFCCELQFQVNSLKLWIHCPFQIEFFQMNELDLLSKIYSVYHFLLFRFEGFYFVFDFTEPIGENNLNCFRIPLSF